MLFTDSKELSNCLAMGGNDLLCSVDGCYLHDPSTVLAVLDPDMFSWRVRGIIDHRPFSSLLVFFVQIGLIILLRSCRMHLCASFTMALREVTR